MISIIVPAHNEAAVIARCLRLLRQGLSAEEAEVVVVCNGCTDDTAVIARATDPDALVLESSRASKANALRLGDEAASGFPRFYVDADVWLDGNGVREVARVLESGEALAAAPRLEVRTEGCSDLVLRFYRMWLSLPYHQEGMIGSGVYALSREGRARFECFPKDLIADDGFVSAHFLPSERATVESAIFQIQAPRSISGVIAIKTRSQKGLMQLSSRFPELQARGHGAHGHTRTLLGRLVDPRQWLDALVYGAVMTWVKWRSYRLQGRSDLMAVWERDESSRKPTQR